MVLVLSVGAFHSTEHFHLHFWKLPVANGTFSGISGKEDNLTRPQGILSMEIDDRKTNRSIYIMR